MTASRALALAVALAACGGDPCGDPVADACGVADLLAPGPFAVGVTTWELTDAARPDATGAPRPLRVEVWYPATADAATAPRALYRLLDEAPASLDERLAGVDVPDIEGEAARDAPVERLGAPYPLVVFSHGNGGLRFQNMALMTHLASHGHVVVAPDHTGDTLWDALDGGLDVADVLESFEDRVADVTFVAGAAVATDGPLAGVADAERWAITGHSFGGAISLAMTSGKPSAPADPRFLAAVPMTPASTLLPLFGYSLTRSRTPTLVLAAARDGTLDYEDEQRAAYGRLSAPKALATVREAGHFSYTDLCRPELQQLAGALDEDVSDILSDGCGEGFIDPATMLDLQRWLVTGWLHAHLRGSAPALDRLAPERLPAELARELEYLTEL